MKTFKYGNAFVEMYDNLERGLKADILFDWGRYKNSLVMTADTKDYDYFKRKIKKRIDSS
ncbi:MAG TPA: hypothetical protein VK982_02480 [Bacteroidales bacterium]|nr:hypothetical protein [Bacteroidales bacterium]